MTVLSHINDIRQRDLNLLVVLRVLLETSSVSKTAQALDVSQSAVSKALERLRAEFHDPLLVRSSNRMFLTERAKMLAPLVGAALDCMERIYGDAAGLDPRAMQRTITMGANEYLQVTLGQALIARLRQDAPSIRVHFQPISSNVPALLAEGRLDLVLGTDFPESRGLRSKVAYQDTFACAASTACPDPVHLTLADLNGWPQIDVSPSGLGSLPRILEQQLVRNGEKRHIVAMLSSYFALPVLLELFGAVAMMPRRVFGHERLRPLLREVPLDFPAPRFEVRLYWHNVTHGDPFSAWLRDLVVELAQTAGAD